MATQFEKFKALHQQSGLFVLPNAWNPKSAMLLEKQGYAAVATSSAAVANSLGYNDGEDMPFSDYLFIIKRIIASVKVPVTVDMEMGYGNSDAEIYDNLKRLIDAGVVGINIEDSVFQDGKRTLGDASKFAKRIAFLTSRLKSDGLSLFINIRCDTYLLNVPEKRRATSERLKLYNDTGASGLFLPCITGEGDIQAAVSSTKLFVNVMCIHGLSDFDTLGKLGVKRASMGPFLFNKVYDGIAKYAESIKSKKTFAPLLE